MGFDLLPTADDLLPTENRPEGRQDNPLCLLERNGKLTTRGLAMAAAAELLRDSRHVDTRK